MEYKNFWKYFNFRCTWCKIWTFDINKNNNINSESLCFISGATDGKIILWKDNTKEEELNLNNENLIRIQKEDKLRMMNYSKE